MVGLYYELEEKFFILTNDKGSVMGFPDSATAASFLTHLTLSQVGPMGALVFIGMNIMGAFEFPEVAEKIEDFIVPGVDGKKGTAQFCGTEVVGVKLYGLLAKEQITERHVQLKKQEPKAQSDNQSPYNE